VNAAVSVAQMARQKNGGLAATADALGWAYHKLGLDGSVIRQLKEAADKTPGNPYLPYHFGMAYVAARRPDLAWRSLRKGSSLFPFPQNAARGPCGLGNTFFQKLSGIKDRTTCCTSIFGSSSIALRQARFLCS
jgi:hypothetical protein